MKKLLIYGTGVVARQIHFYNERYQLYDIVGYIDDNDKSEKKFMGKPVFRFEKLPPPIHTDFSDTYIIVSIGYTHCNTVRERVCKKVAEAGYSLANFITRGSNIWENTVKGKNIIIFDNVFVGIGCKLNDGVIISEGSTLSHDISVGPYTFFSDEVTVGGFANIGRNSFVGLNSTIKSGLDIGDYNIIASGTNVVKSSTDKCVIKGNPGRNMNKDTLIINI